MLELIQASHASRLGGDGSIKHRYVRVEVNVTESGYCDFSSTGEQVPAFAIHRRRTFCGRKKKLKGCRRSLSAALAGPPVSLAAQMRLAKKTIPTGPFM